MYRSVIVRCLARAGSDDVQYAARAICDTWDGAEVATSEFYAIGGTSYQRGISVLVWANMSYRVYLDSISATGSDNLHYAPDEMHPIQTPDTLFAAVDVARAYAWPEEYAAFERKRMEDAYVASHPQTKR